MTTTAMPKLSPSSRGLVLVLVLLEMASCYQRSPCPSSSRRQFQFPDCSAPDLDANLPIGAASFVMAHDAATGYLDAGGRGRRDDDGLDEAYGSEYDGVDDMNAGGGSGRGNDGGSGNKWSGAIATRLLSLYGKNQVGTAYDQLNDGARALDLRPKVYDNGTVGFHHGTLIDVPLVSITLGGLLDDVRRWCRDNPTELVLVFHSELAHESGYDGLSTRVAYYAEDSDGVNEDEGDDGGYYYAGITRMKAVYGRHGVSYLPCERLSGLTVGDVMAMANLSKTGGRGYLLAVDRHDMYASFCGKANWVQNQLVTCHSRYYGADGNSIDNDIAERRQQNSYVHCTDTKGSGLSKLGALKAYVKASSNNDATDNYNSLGPPADAYYYPFNQIQGFWQVDAASVRIGTSRASNLLDDNRRSGVNGEMVRMAL